MNTLHVSGVEIVEHSVETIGSNSLKGDLGVSLNIGERVDGKGKEPFIGTNGDPMIITVEGGDPTCSIGAAAEALEMTPDELIEHVRSFCPEIEWPTSIVEVSNDESI